MDSEILLTTYNGIGRIILSKQRLFVEIACFSSINENPEPVLVSDLYETEELANVISITLESFDMFAFCIYEDGQIPLEDYVFSNTEIIIKYPLIKKYILECALKLRQKMGHYSIVDINAISKTLDQNIIKFNVWGKLLIDPESDFVYIELATKIEKGSVLIQKKRIKTEQNQIKMKKTAQLLVVSDLESGNWPTTYLTSSLIESEKDYEICITVMAFVIDNLRKQLGFFTLGEDIRREDNFDD